jgi:hypothetical protein
MQKGFYVSIPYEPHRSTGTAQHTNQLILRVCRRSTESSMPYFKQNSTL